jgi:prophage antirepressor-like protein
VNESFTPSAGGAQKTNYIPEGDLYRLIIRSKLPAAERFETWVFDEVLPTIRKYGAYAAPETLDEMLRSPDFAAALAGRLDEERKKRAVLLELVGGRIIRAEGRIRRYKPRLARAAQSRRRETALHLFSVQKRTHGHH